MRSSWLSNQTGKYFDVSQKHKGHELRFALIEARAGGERRRSYLDRSEESGDQDARSGKSR